MASDRRLSSCLLFAFILLLGPFAEESRRLLAEEPGSPTLDELLSSQEKELLATLESAPEGDYLELKSAAEATASWEEAFLRSFDSKLDEASRAIVASLEGNRAVLRRVLGSLMDEDDRVKEALASEVTAAGAALESLLDEAAEDEDRGELVVKSQQGIAPGLSGALRSRSESVKRAAKSSTLDELRTMTEKNLELQRQLQEKELLAQFDKEGGSFSVVQCRYSSSESTLNCDKEGLRHGGVYVAAVRVSGLPAGARMRVSARIAENGLVAAPASAGAECNLAVDASCDRVDYRPSAGRVTAGSGRSVLALIHTQRFFGATYRTRKMQPLVEALPLLRTGGDRDLVLVANGDGRLLVIRVEVEEQDGWHVVEAALPFLYERWKFETGSFFAVSDLVDRKLVLAPADDDSGEVVVREIVEADSIRQESGLYLNLIPNNYEWFGIGVGFHTSSDRSLSYYLGLSLRIRSLGDRALASFGVGMIGAQSRRFPGVEVGERYELTDKVLEGSMKYGESWYALLSLGFRFGPIGADLEGD